MLYQSPTDQAWLRLWVGLFGRDSKLSRYLQDEHDEHRPEPVHARRSPLEDQARKPASRDPRTPPLEKKARPSTVAKPRDRAARRIDRDVERVTRLPTSEWAKRIVADGRLIAVTLQDILDGIEDYFEIFTGLRKVNPDAYAYFSRVGAPIIMENVAIWESQITAPLVRADPALLPSYFGMFIYSTRDHARRSVIEDKASFPDFHLFEKPKNYATVVAPGTTVFTHNQFNLKRAVFTKEEMRRFPFTRRSWGYWWYLGVDPNGQVRALPHRMNRQQRLPNGDHVHHSGFEIPPGLYEMGREKGKPHDFVREYFNVAVAITAAAMSGIQVSIRKGKENARFGVPIGALKTFFADRDPGNNRRRKPIIHFRPGHDRHMADGRIIEVGEHLAGERHFTWRGYEVTVGVPGIHFAAPEGLNAPLYFLDDPNAPLPEDMPPRDELVSMKSIAKTIGGEIWRARRVPFRRGEPTQHFATATLPQPEPKGN